MVFVVMLSFIKIGINIVYFFWCFWIDGNGRYLVNKELGEFLCNYYILGYGLLGEIGEGVGKGKVYKVLCL